MYKFKTEQILPISLQQAWEFFSSPANLSRITPPELDFKVLSPINNGAITKGMIIDYKVRPLLNIPVHWQTEIGEVKPKEYFTDRQLKGPYKQWIHNHRFIEVNGGVLVQDEVVYELPLGFLGKIVHSLVVKKKIEKIFDHRKRVLNKLFS